MKKNISILILDDHSLFLNGISELIKKNYPESSIQCFNSISSITSRVYDYNKHDIIISDMELPRENIYDFFSEVRKQSQIPILVVSMHKKIVAINQCKRLGINGYILKNDDEYLIKAIKEIILGNNFFSPVLKRLLSSSKAQNLIISEREKQVIKLICGAYSNMEIAEKLIISIETVKSHKRNIKIKLGLKTNHDIVNFANENIII